MVASKTLMFGVIAVITIVVLGYFLLRNKEKFSATTSNLTFVNEFFAPIEIRRYKTMPGAAGETYSCKIVPDKWTDAVELNPQEKITMNGWAGTGNEMFIRVVLMSGNTRDVTNRVFRKTPMGPKAASVSTVSQWAAKNKYKISGTCGNMKVAQVMGNNVYRIIRDSVGDDD